MSDISVACDVESGAGRRGEDARGTFMARIPTMPDAPVLPGGWAIGGGFVATAAVFYHPFNNVCSDSIII